MAICVSLRVSLFVGTGVYVPDLWKDGVLVSAPAFKGAYRQCMWLWVYWFMGTHSSVLV